MLLLRSVLCQPVLLKLLIVGFSETCSAVFKAVCVVLSERIFTYWWYSSISYPISCFSSIVASAAWPKNETKEQKSRSRTNNIIWIIFLIIFDFRFVLLALWALLVSLRVLLWRFAIHLVSESPNLGRHFYSWYKCIGCCKSYHFGNSHNIS